MEILEIEFEQYQDVAKTLEPPAIAFLVHQDDNPDVLCFYPYYNGGE